MRMIVLCFKPDRVSLAVQIFYPDDFNGCFGGAPDPIDFRCGVRSYIRHTLQLWAVGLPNRGPGFPIEETDP